MNPQDTHHFNFSSEQLNNFLKGAGIVCVGMLTLFLLVKTVNEAKTYSTIGEEAISSPAGMQNTISVSGQSEMFVRPDITVFTWTATGEGKTAEEAENKAVEKGNKAIEFLKSKGIKEADLKTVNFSTYPQYGSKTEPCAVSEPAVGSRVKTMAPSVGMAEPYMVAQVAPCNVSSQVISGYTTTESVEVKVRDIKDNSKKVGELIAGVTALGVTSGTPVSTVDQPELFKRKVRDEAILKARQQAEVLAKALGVKLVRITSFNENSYPYPMYDSVMSARSMSKAESIVPDLPVGTNKISADVTITYQIR